MTSNCFLLTTLVCLGPLLGCSTREVLTEIDPYSNVVGHRYVLKEDCYTFHFGDAPKNLQLGAPRFYSNLRNALDKERFPNGFGSIDVDESVPKGSSFVITEVVREKTIETVLYDYLARLDCPDGRTRLVNVWPLMNLLASPPIVDDRIATEKR